jgi:amino acid transporter
VFAALPAGEVFALQGYEQAVQMAGEARHPRRDVSRAIISAVVISTTIYLALEVAFVAGIDPANIVDGWSQPVTSGDFGPYATIATAAGAGWFAVILYVNAFVSPAGTGLVYVGTSARLSFAMGMDPAMPDFLTKLSSRRVPVYSILLAFVVGEIAFLPFRSWQSFVGLVTASSAIMYAFAPVSLAALARRDAYRARPYRMPAPRLLAPTAFAAANLIIYWSGFEATWKILAAVLVGRVMFEIALRRQDDARREDGDWRAASWIWPWLTGLTIIGLLGRYGVGAQQVMPEWVDLIVVITYSVGVFHYAVNMAMSPDKVLRAVNREEWLASVQQDITTA